MKNEIEGIHLDQENIEFNKALEFVELTNQIVFLTGKAGTGKTTFLKYLKTYGKKNTVILAPTGVAAINAGGQTIHSFFQIAPSIYVPNDKRLRIRSNSDDLDKSTIFDHFKYRKEHLTLIREIELMVIDEVSMVRCDLLDVIDTLLRVFRKNRNEPFGGVQMVLIGDPYQLPPVAKNEEWNILSKFYKSPFFFSSYIISKNTLVFIELKKIYRQKDDEFIELLNKVRLNNLNKNDFEILNSRYKDYIEDKDSKYITLATHNKTVDSINQKKLSEIDKELFSFEAIISGNFPEHIFPSQYFLDLKETSQIMFLKNDRDKRFHNGKIGKVKSLEDDLITVEILNENKEYKEIFLEKAIWENIRYRWNNDTKRVEEEVIGTFTQYPLKLAWAITVHKSQGLTFENVIADLGSAFAPGQVYVALSRCTSFEGLLLKSKINKYAIMTDDSVVEFSKRIITNHQLDSLLIDGIAEKYYKEARNEFKKGNFGSALNFLNSAIKYRNYINTELFKRYLDVLFKKYFGENIKLNKIKTEMHRIIKNSKNVSIKKHEILYYKLFSIDRIRKAVNLAYNARTHLDPVSYDIKADGVIDNVIIKNIQNRILEKNIQLKSYFDFKIPKNRISKRNCIYLKFEDYVFRFLVSELIFQHTYIPNSVYWGKGEIFDMFQHDVFKEKNDFFIEWQKNQLNKSEYNYIITVDISNYYDSITPEIIHNRIVEELNVKKTSFFSMIIKEFSKRISIGNYTDNFLQNFYLLELDRKMENYRDCIYGRVSDDIRVFTDTEGKAKIILSEIKTHLKSINLSINYHKSFVIEPVKEQGFYNLTNIIHKDSIKSIEFENLIRLQSTYGYIIPLIDLKNFPREYYSYNDYLNGETGYKINDSDIEDYCKNLMISSKDICENDFENLIKLLKYIYANYRFYRKTYDVYLNLLYENKNNEVFNKGVEILIDYVENALYIENDHYKLYLLFQKLFYDHEKSNFYFKEIFLNNRKNILDMLDNWLSTSDIIDSVYKAILLTDEEVLKQICIDILKKYNPENSDVSWRSGKKWLSIINDVLDHYDEPKYFKEDIYRRIHEVFPNTPLLIIKYLKTLYEKEYKYEGEYKKIIVLIDKLFQLEYTPKYLFKRAFAYYEIKKYQEALSDYNEYINEFKSSAAYNNRALIYEHFKDYDKAIIDLKKAIKIDPEEEVCRKNLDRLIKKSEN